MINDATGLDAFVQESSTSCADDTGVDTGGDDDDGGDDDAGDDDAGDDDAGNDDAGDDDAGDDDAGDDDVGDDDAGDDDAGDDDAGDDDAGDDDAGDDDAGDDDTGDDDAGDDDAGDNDAGDDDAGDDDAGDDDAGDDDAGDDDAGDEDTGADDGDDQQDVFAGFAVDQFDGAISTSDPQTIDGNVGGAFGIDLSGTIFEAARRGPEALACDRCSVELARLEADRKALSDRIENLPITEDLFTAAIESAATDQAGELRILTADQVRATIDAIESNDSFDDADAIEEFNEALGALAQLNDAIEEKKAECNRLCPLPKSSRNTSPSLFERSTLIKKRTLGNADAGSAQQLGDGDVLASGDTLTLNFDLREFRETQGVSQSLGGRSLLTDPRFNVFASGSISFGENNDGALDQDSFSYGFSLGASYLLTPTLNLGVAGRFAKADIDDVGSDLDVTTFGLAAFAQAKLDPITIGAIAAYSRSDIDGEFTGATGSATANTDTDVFSGQITASTQFTIEDVTLTPNASVSYVSSNRDAFTLSNGEVAPGNEEDSVIFSLGGSASTSFEMKESGWTLSPSIGFAVAENTQRSDGPTLGGTGA